MSLPPLFARILGSTYVYRRSRQTKGAFHACSAHATQQAHKTHQRAPGLLQTAGFHTPHTCFTPRTYISHHQCATVASWTVRMRHKYTYIARSAKRGPPHGLTGRRRRSLPGKVVSVGRSTPRTPRRAPGPPRPPWWSASSAARAFRARTAGAWASPAATTSYPRAALAGSGGAVAS